MSYVDSGTHLHMMKNKCVDLIYAFKVQKHFTLTLTKGLFYEKDE
jgi:hypothetical protein